MTPSNQVLGGIFAVQVVLVGLTWMPGADTTVAARKPLDFTTDQLTELVLTDAPREGAEPESVRLVKEASGWVIASAGDYPADPTKVTELVDKLVAIQLRTPIATRAEAHPQLTVAADEYTRKVVWKAGDKAGAFWLGTGSGRGANLRVDGEGEVYSVGSFSPWTVRTTVNGWYNPQLFDTDPSSVSRFELRGPSGAFTLVREEAGWTSPQLGEGQALAQAKVEDLLRTTTKLRINKPVGKVIPPEAGFDQAIRVSWTRSDGDSSRSEGYALGGAVEGDRYVQAEGSPHAVRVGASAVERLLQASLDELLVVVPEGGLE